MGEIKDPAAFARTAFIEALERAGIIVSARATGSNPSHLLPSRGSYREAERVAEHVSAPLKVFTRVILNVSHNPGADLMACLSAVKAGSRNCADGLQQAFEVFTGLGISADCFSLGVLEVSGTEAQTQVNLPAAGHVQVKSGTRVAGIRAGQGLLTGQTKVGYATTRSGSQLAFAIMVRDVPFSTMQAILDGDDNLGSLAVAIQQGY